MDIDHLYLCSYEYHTIDDMGAPIVTRHFDPTTDSLEKYYQNKILENILTLLGDVENSMNSLYKSIDNDTELLTDISDIIPNEDSDKHLPFNFGTLSEQIFRRTDYITGKTGIGPFALNVTNQVLTYLYGVKFKSTTFTTSVGLDGLDKIIDIGGNYVNSWLSGFINAHVDIIKDPFISKLNTNPFTYNMINLLIRAGWGEAAIWFVCQPIIRDLAFADSIAESQYARNTDIDKSKFAAKKSAKEKAVLKYMTADDISDEKLMPYINGTDKNSILEKIRVVRKIKDNTELYKQIALHPNAKTVTVNGKTYDVWKEQQDVFYAWKSLEKYMNALNKLVQYTKIDTRKHGKTFIEINAYLANYDAFFHPLIDDSVFDMTSIKRLIDNSWIEQKTRSAIEYPRKIFAGQTFNANPKFVETIVEWAETLSTGMDGYVSNKLLNSLSRALQTAIKSQYIISYAKKYLKHDDAYIAGLFVENGNRNHPGTMNNRLNRILNAIKTNPDYARLKSNMLLNQLTTVSQENDYVINGATYQKPKFITVSSLVTNSKVNETAFREAWLDLLNDEDKFVRSFARDLIIYSFLTSGEYNGWNKLFKYVPLAWISGEVDTDYQSFSDYVQGVLNSGCQGFLSESTLDNIVSNNFNDFDICKKLQKKDSETKEIRYVTSKDKNILIGAKIKANDKKSIAPYVVITKSDYFIYNNVFSNDVYKLVGTVEHSGNKKYYTPIYIRIPKRGYHNNKHYDIYEYGWNFNYAENYTDIPENLQSVNIVEKLAPVIKSFDFMKLGDDSVQEAISKVLDNNTDPINKPVERKWQRASKHYSREDAANDPTTLYIFTDNTDRTSGGASYEDGWYKEKYGEGGYGSTNNPTSAIIRGLPNAVPISTMKWFYKNHPEATHPAYDPNSAARWHDSDFDEFKKVFDDEIQQIKDLWDTGKFTKVISPTGDQGRSPFFGSKLTEITKQRTPKIYNYMLQEFKKLQDYIEQAQHQTTGDSMADRTEELGQELSSYFELLQDEWKYLEDSTFDSSLDENMDLLQDTSVQDMTQNEQTRAEELMKRCKGGE